MDSPAEADGLAHLLRLDPARREEWLDRHQPAPEERVNWWLYLLLGIGFQIAGQPAQHREWVQLSLWLMDAGHVRGVLTDAHYAEKRAYFALEMRRKAAIDADLPSADDIVRACLQAIQLTPEAAAIRKAGLDPASVPLALLKGSRQAKILVSVAQCHLDLVADEQLAGQLRDWIGVKPHLV